MFLRQITEQNLPLVQEAVRQHQSGEILPDTFLVDMDTLQDNAIKMKRTADQHHIDLYFMLKQLGHNPYIADKLMKIGYPGAVVVDWKEATVMMQHHIPIMNVGHLVQPPSAIIRRLVNYGCEYFTVYSLEKIREINAAAEAAGIVQKLLLRITEDGSVVYSGQAGGFQLAELDDLIREAAKMDRVQIAGVTSFPCFLYSEKNNRIESTQNMGSLLKAKEILESHGLCHLNINAPSATCISSLRQMEQYGVTSCEPGHGLTGTTPLHAHGFQEERPCVLYLSEVSHNYDHKAYIYGGGYYRRGHVRQALVCHDGVYEYANVQPPAVDSIDYHFELDREFPVGSTVIMAFRFQIFTSRSDICLMEGLHAGNPKTAGFYDSFGKLER